MNNTTGSNNTANGLNALFSNTGSNNTAVGVGAGSSLTTGDNADAVNVVIDSNGQLGTASSSRRFKKEIKPMDQTSEAILRSSR